MIIHNMPQGSPEWHALRVGKVTGTSSSKVVGSKWLEYSDTIAAERITGIRKDSGFKSESMERGSELEFEARNLAAQELGIQITEVGFIQHESFPHFGMSPDGLVGINPTKGVVEIKCPDQDTHVRYIRENKIPTTYRHQLISAFVCSNEIEYVVFVSYCPEVKQKPLFIKVLYLTECGKEVAELTGALTKFFKQVEQTIEMITF